MLRLPVSPVRPLVGAYAICGVFSAKSFKWLFQLLELFSVRSENVILFHDEDDMCRLTDKFAEKGIYASEEENGEYMCQLSPNNPLWGSP